MAAMRSFMTQTVRAGLTAAVLAAGAGLVAPTSEAASLEGTNRDDVLIGKDDDNEANPLIQPTGAVNQSLNNADAINGRNGDDLLIGLLGSDTIIGGRGDDVIIGGVEGGQTPNSDIIFGGDHDDVNVWRAGDGSDAFIGGSGLDAQVFGTIDRDANNVPLINPATGKHAKTGLPSADVTGQGGFCTLEDVRGEDLGYEFLVRFFVRATGALAVTIRLADVEQVFCTNEEGGSVIFADLTDPNPAFGEISLDDVEELNPTVRQIIR